MLSKLMPPPATLPYHYRAYGLVIASAVPLLELIAIDAPAQTADITISIGALPEVGPEHGPATARRIGPFLWATSEEFWFCVPRIARFRIAHGNEIIVDPFLPGDQGSVRTFLLGTALGVALAQRGHLLLHGNAIRIGDGCVVCVGRSGAGKSTLAAGFRRRGFALFADDLVMVDDQCRVAPGVPRIKLWADMTLAMEIDTSPLRRIRPNLEKFSYPVWDNFAETALPIRAIYRLVTTNADAVSIEHIADFAKFGEVHANTYRPQFIDVMAMREQTMAFCARLAAKIPVARASRPVHGFTLDILVDAILEDLGETP